MSQPAPYRAPGDHGALLQQRLPRWIRHASVHSIDTLGLHLRPAQHSDGAPAPWFTQASEAEQRKLLEYQQRRLRASHRLAHDLKGLKGLMAFAEPLLEQGLREQLGVELDVSRNEFVEVRFRTVLLDSFLDLRRQSLLQAALQNFSSDATFDARSALAPLGSVYLDWDPFVDGSPVNARYRLRERLDIEPQRFARLCHALDLGGQYQRHLSEVYEQPATRERIRRHGMALYKAMLRVDLQVAFMSAAIGADAKGVVAGLLNGEADNALLGRPVEVLQLQMFGATLADVLLIRPQPRGPADGPVLLWLPGAIDSPLKEYTDFAALHLALQHLLRQDGGQKLLASHVRHDDQPHVFSRLDKALYQWTRNRHGLRVRQPTLSADLYLTTSPLAGEVFGQLQDLHLARLKQDALSMAVPSARVDASAAEVRRHHWESLGLDFANLAAFFLPGLGAIMALVTVVQLVGEVVEGIQAWALGDLDEAWGHLANVGLNVAMFAGFGLLHSVAPAKGSELVDGLLPVELPDGRIKLWKPDLAPYASTVELGDTQADTRGLYPQQGKHYLPLEGRLHEVFSDRPGRWRVRHPGDTQAYAPELRHNGSGAWWFEGEQPRQWSRQKLLQRLGPVSAGLDAVQLSQASEISGIQDDVLRAVYIGPTAVPAVLVDCLERARLHRRVDHLIEAVRTGQPLDAREGFVARLAVKLPHWPNRVLEVFEHDRLEGPSLEYGRSRWPQGQVIRVARGDLAHDRLARTLLGALTPEESVALLGDGVEPGQEVGRLHALLAEQAGRRRSAIFARYQAAAAHTASAESNAVRRDFPLLPDGVIEELLEHWPASPVERARLQGGRLPLRLAEEARRLQRQVRLSRAIEGLQEPAASSLDSDRLGLALLDTLPGWPGDLRLVLTDLARDGQPVASAGPADGAPLALVRNHGLYGVTDEHGVEHVLPFAEALLQVIGPGRRAALGLSEGQGRVLRQHLFDAAVSDRGRAGQLLGQPPAQAWFRSPLRLADGRLGYPLGGLVDRFSSANARLGDLYPDIGNEARDALKLRLVLQGTSLGQAISNLEDEFAMLAGGLQAWAEGGAQESLSRFERSNRRQLSRRLLNCWRRSPLDRRYRLDLSDLHVSRLPILTGSFDHVRGLQLTRMGLNELPVSFTGAFHRLRELNLRDNRLGELPQALAQMGKLQELDLAGNRIDFTQPSGGLLGQLRRLQRLDLRFNELPIPQAVLAQLAELPLRVLNLSHNLLTLDASGVDLFSRMHRLEHLSLARVPLGRAPALGELTRLQTLNLREANLSQWPDGLEQLMDLEPCILTSVDLDGNAIRDLPALAGTRFAELLREQGHRSRRLHVRQNPLGAQALRALRAVQPFHDLLPEELDPTNEFWLQGSSAERQALWQALLESPANARLFEVLGRLGLARETVVDGPGMRERVWTLLELAGEHESLLTELQEIADSAPITCGDAGADAFSELETAALVYRETRTALDHAGRRRDLLRVYNQLYRRAQVQRLADHLALRRGLRNRALLEALEPPALDPLDSISDEVLRVGVDDVEIRLFIRQKLAGPLDYHEPSQGMLFANLAQVSSQTLDAIADTVRALDRVEPRRAWLVQNPGWQRYLRLAYPAAFLQAANPWREGLEYVETCAGLGEDPVQRLEPEVVQVLQPVIPGGPLDPSGALRTVSLDSQRYLEAVQALQRAHAEAEEALLLSLTRAEQLQA